jgi:DNA adenine methylase
MLYLGGKGRLGKPLTEAILSMTDKRETYVEPFIGGGNLFRHIAPHFRTVHAGDSHEDLMLMWNAVANGWIPPDTVSEAEYRAQRHASSSALRGLVGFGCSFGGKWWGGYARSKCNGNDYYARHAARSVSDIARLMPPNVKGSMKRCSFEAWTPVITADCVIYADPPYAKTTGYKGGFDHDEFWRTMTHWTDIGATVFVSEYVAPSGWEAVWRKEQRRKVSGGTGAMTHESLFARKAV